MSESPGRKLRSRLSQRLPQIVVNIDYTNASLVEFLGHVGADVIFIDCEQGDTSIESIPDLVRAAHCAGVPAVVRLPSPDPAVIERYMFRGVDGIVVPRLTAPEQAKAVVETVRYCFPAQHPDKAVIVQIEDIAAVRALDAFLDIDGIDCFFVGPVDLSKSMGHRGDYACAPVAAEIERTIGRMTKRGRAVGILAKPDTLAALVGAGVSFLYLHTNDFITLGAAQILRSLATSAPKAKGKA